MADSLMSAIDNYYKEAPKEAPKETAKEAPKEEPKKLLEGRVEFTPEMEKRDEAMSKAVFPQPEDHPALQAFKTAMMIPSAMSEGAGSVPETLGNFVAGGAQQLANVPPQQRITVADVVRKIPGMHGFVSPTELSVAPKFQAQMQQNPMARAIYNPAKFVGGVGFPLAGAEAALTRPAVNLTKTAIPLADFGKNVTQIARNATPESILNIIKYAQHPLKGFATGAASGAAYAPVFAGGQQFGATRTMPTLPEQVQNAGAGAAFGGLLGSGVNALQNFLLRRNIQGLARNSQLPQLPSTMNAAQKEVLPNAKQMKTGITALTYKNLGTNTNRSGTPRTDAQKQAVQRRVFGYAQNKFGSESDEHSLALAEAIRDWEKLNYQKAKVEQNRSYSERKAAEKAQISAANKQEGRQYTQGQQQANIQRTGEHTATSGERFEDLSRRIQSASTRADLDSFRNEIFNPGTGPKGQRLLDSGHQKELDRQWRDAYYGRLREEGGRPGESSSPTAPTGGQAQIPQNNLASRPPASSSERGPGAPPADAQGVPKMAQEANPQSATMGGASEKPKIESTPKITGTKDFLKGAFRKTVKFRGGKAAREERYKYAVSPQALAKEAGLSHEETAALDKWTAEASEMARELTYKKLQLEQLVEWADKNEDVWIGKQDNVKARHDADAKGDAVTLLEHQKEEGMYKTLALRAKMDRYYEQKTQDDLQWVKMNMLRYGAQREGLPLETGLKAVGKPEMRVTTNGIAQGGNQENLDGSLELLGGIRKLDLGEFKPPASADELFSRAKNLKNWISHFDSKLADVRHAAGDYNHLDGTTPAQVMEKAFASLEDAWKGGKPNQPPSVNLWHVDKTGHVSTVQFVQPKTREAFPKQMKDLEDKYKLLEKLVLENKGKDGKVKYDAIWAKPHQLTNLMAYFPGMEAIPILSTIFGKRLHNVARAIGGNTNFHALQVGAIDNILRANERFGGDEASDAFRGMLSNIQSEFFYDKRGQWHPVKSAEELSDLLNDFKGVEIARSHYVKHAMEEAHKAGTDSDVEMLDHIRRAETAFMIRSKYKQTAKLIQGHIEEMDIRREDSRTGYPSPEGRKFYVPGTDLDDMGRVRRDAYDASYHTALRELHKGLTLQGEVSDGVASLIGDIASRKISSIMGNNPAVALKNFFDQLPITLAYFDKHFMYAVGDLMKGGAVKEHLDRLPIIPQADMSLVKLEERLKDARPAKTFAEKATLTYAKINHFLLTKTDLIFGGKQRLVSYADRQFTYHSALASFYKEAQRRGMNRHEFMDDLMNRRFDKQSEEDIFKQMVTDINTVYNSVAPHLNKDLFANSTTGKLLANFATPGRRAFRVEWDWMRSDKVSDKLRFLAAWAGLVALGGSGANPQTLQFALRLGAAATGHAADFEQSNQQLDEYNILRRYTGIDYSANFGPDIFTTARPTLEGLEKAGPELAKTARDAKSNEELLSKLAIQGVEGGLALFPRMGGFGYDVWQKLFKNEAAAAEGSKEVYFEYNGALHSVMIPDYTYHDALRDWLIGGTNPKAFKAIQHSKLQSAIKSDMKYSASKNALPERSSTGSDTRLPALGIKPSRENI